MSASASQIEAMDVVTEDLWRMVRELRATYVVLPDAAAESVRQAKIALEELQGDLRQAVLTDGGVHKSQARAWAAWVDLATSTGDMLTQAAGFADRYSLTGYLLKAGEVLVDTAKNVAIGGAGLGVVALVVLAIVLVARR